MKVKLKKIMEEVESVLLSIKASNPTSTVQAQVLGYILELQDRLATEQVTVVNEKGTDVTKPFIVKLDELVKSNLDRTPLFEFEEVEIDFLEPCEEYSRCPKSTGAGSVKNIILRTIDRVEVGRCVISGVDMNTFINIDFIELKERYNKIYSIFDVLDDCILAAYGPVKFAFGADFLGFEVSR